MKTCIASILVLFSPVVRAELTEKEIKSNVNGIEIKHIYRDDIKILEVASPAKDAPKIYVNTTYTIIADDLPLYKYKTSKSESSFQRLNFVNMNYAIKLHASGSGTIKGIIVYTRDFSKTIEAYHLEDGKLIPFSNKELADRRRVRNEH